MWTEYNNLLEQEIKLFKAARDTEIEKRKFILGADGRKLQGLNGKSEILLKEIHALQDKREDMGMDLLKRLGHVPGDLTLTALVNLAGLDNPGQGRDMEKTAEDYRASVHALKAETDENHRILNSTSGSIQRMLAGLKKIVSPDDGDTYSPDGRRESRAAGSVLLNATG